MRTDDFIDQLTRESAEASRLPRPSQRTLLWLAWSVAYMLLVALGMFAATERGGVTSTPLYVLQQMAAMATGIAAAHAAFVSVIPGAGTRVWRRPAAGAAVWVALMLWNSVLEARAAITVEVAAETDWPCVASMAVGAIVLGGPLVWMLRRGAPLTPRATAFLAGLAALSVANVEACLTRPHASAMTPLLWHGLTVVVISGVFALLGRLWLRWPTLAAR